MLNILDIVPEPTTEAIELSATITPWFAAYISIGLLIVAAVIITIKLIVKSNKSKKQ